MKRDESLSPLSRDHHQALFQAMRLRKADGEDLAEVQRGVLEYWIGHGSRHFRIEEELLLPAYARHADPAQQAVERVLVDHVWIRERMARLQAGELDLAGSHELGDRLEGHVRHEERVLFPLIEEALPREELDELGQVIELAESAPAPASDT